LAYVYALARADSTLTKGDLLFSKRRAALLESELHSSQHAIFCEAIPTETVDEWEALVVAWENDKTNKDPYVVLGDCKMNVFCLCTSVLLTGEIVKSQATIRLELVEAERAALTGADTTASDMSPSAFVILGLELEEAQ